VPHLMIVTAAIAEALLNLFGIPAYRQGMVFVLPGGSFEVADVCSGLKYLLAGTVISILYAYLTYGRMWKRVTFVVFAALLFVLMNGVRAFVVMAVASATQMRWLTGEDHITFGRILFGVLILALFWGCSRFADPQPQREAGPEIVRTPRIPVLSWLVAAAILALGPALAARQSFADTGAEPVLQLPALASCQEPGPWNLDWRPTLIGPDVELGGGYICESDVAHLYVAAYRNQSQGRELVADGHELVAPPVLALLERNSAEFAGASGERIRVAELRGYRDSRQLVIWYWYSFNGRHADSGAELKLREACAVITGRPSLSAVHMVVMEAPLTAEQVSNGRIEEFAAAAWAHYVSAEAWRDTD